MMLINEITEKQALEVLAGLQEEFIRRWGPYSKPELADFRRELLYLVHSVYREAQRPVVERFAQVIAAMPALHILITAPEKKG